MSHFKIYWGQATPATPYDDHGSI